MKTQQIYALAFAALVAMCIAFIALVRQIDAARSWVFHTYDVQTALQAARLDAATHDFERAQMDVVRIQRLTKDNAAQSQQTAQLQAMLLTRDLSRFDSTALIMIENEDKLLAERRRTLIATNYKVHAIFFLLSLATAGAIAWTIKSNRDYHVQLESKNVALIEASRAKDVFLASMSHELRTPLNSIMGFVGILLMKLPGPLTQEQDRQLRVVQGSARHLLSLINDILDLARIESGRVELMLDKVSVAKLVDEVCSELRGIALQKSISLNVELPEQEISVQTDARSAKQILTNIIGNAIKFTKDGGVTVTVAVQVGTGKASVLVRDTGPGIPPEQQVKLFAPFAQFRHSPGQEGTGLGLHISRKLADLIGATISVESDVSKGSTFSVTFPLDA